MTTRASRADLFAGLSIAGLLLPEAVAYSGVANLPPQAGVIALFVGLVCYSLIGRSRFAIVTATSSSAAVLASATLTLGGGDLAQRVALAATLVAGAGIALAGLFGLERVARAPGALAVIIASILASPWLAAHGVALTGPVHLALAMPAFALPSGTGWLPLTEFAFALMFILYAESYGSIRTFALKHDEEVQPNRDLLAFGVANIVSGLFQGTPVAAGYSGTAANAAAGAQSRFAGLFAAGIVLVLVLLFLRWIERIPEPVLAAIVIHAVSKSLRISVFRDYFRWQRDRLVVVAAVLAVMIFGVLNGLLAAIAFSLAMLLKSLASPRLSVLGRVGAHDYVSVERFPNAVTVPGVLVLRPEAPLFFANAEPLLAQARQQVLSAPDTRLVIFSLEESPDLDSTALEALEEFCSWSRARGGELRLARLKERARDALVRAKLAHLPTTTLDYASVDDAVRGQGVSPNQLLTT